MPERFSILCMALSPHGLLTQSCLLGWRCPWQQMMWRLPLGIIQTDMAALTRRCPTDVCDCLPTPLVAPTSACAPGVVEQGGAARGGARAARRGGAADVGGGAQLGQLGRAAAPPAALPGAAARGAHHVAAGARPIPCRPKACYSHALPLRPPSARPSIHPLHRPYSQDNMHPPPTTCAIA